MKKTCLTTALLLIISLVLSGCTFLEPWIGGGGEEEPAAFISLNEIPPYSGTPYVEINGGLADFDPQSMTTESFEEYGDLDELGRCTYAWACIGEDLMPHGDREQISSIHPTGWHRNKYDFIDGELLYNRCHLIAYSLAGETLNEENLITGTRYMNTRGMLPFEEWATSYVHRTGNHVMYEVTPIFSGSNLVADGVHMQAKSVEDDGAGVEFNVYCYNVQPKIFIDYATGDNRFLTEEEIAALPYDVNAVEGADGRPAWEQENDTGEDLVNGPKSTLSDKSVSEEEVDYVVNVRSGKFHLPNCEGAGKISGSNRLNFKGSRQELIDAGYSPCGECKP